jgi:hypothetical protein
MAEMSSSQKMDSSTTKKLSQKQRRALSRAFKREARAEEDRLRLVKRAQMFVTKSRESLQTFIDCKAMASGVPQVVACQLDLPLWDVDLLVEDATQLLNTFQPGLQFGDTHNGTWKTLSLRSADGSTNSDAPSPNLQYIQTEAWRASTYIIPVVLASFGPILVDCLERVRLSIIPPGSNVAWHTDHDSNQHHVTRVHIPILCSTGFMLNIGGTPVRMQQGETWIGNFELPHRVGNEKNGTPRVHLIIDILLPLVPVLPVVPVVQACWMWLMRMYSCCSVSTPRLPTEAGVEVGVEGVGVGVHDPQTKVFTAAAAELVPFELALNAAVLLLMTPGDVAATARRQACIAAFSDYRWCEGETTAGRASVEFDYYITQTCREQA